ncbi:MAG: hypothetical protein NVSMB55_09710 [Mycobacteriales bacterium]
MGRVREEDEGVREQAAYHFRDKDRDGHREDGGQTALLRRCVDNARVGVVMTAAPVRADALVGGQSISGRIAEDAHTTAPATRPMP